MDALELLLSRRSIPKLSLPAPTGATLENIIQAGLRAPDHGNLTPWRFLIAEGEGLEKLSAVFEQGATLANLDEKAVQKAAKAPYRAPMVITIVAKVAEHPNVPYFEQYLSAGCAVQAMQMAAVAQGFQAFWRSGAMMYNANVKAKLGLGNEDAIVGFLYVGSATCTPLKVPERDSSQFVEYL